MQKLLVIDDEPNITYSMEQVLTSPELNVVCAGTAAAGIATIQEVQPDAVLLDIHLPDMSGLQAFDQIHRLDPRLPVVMITAYAKTETAIEAMRRGAFEYLVKPVDLERLKQIVARALEVSRLNRRPAVFDAARDQEDSTDRIVGNSPAMQEVYKSIGRIAPQDAVVLILGESGTGKELVARAIYHYSRRASQPFLAINCAALPETLLESELFGHERGAFTGADQRRIGKFEQVHGGTIFLDEIGDMSAATQAKALRLLQEQQFQRLGGNALVKTDVRVIAATNKDLAESVTRGEFREDLFYRLNGFTIRLPALRERKEDLPLLIDHLLRRACHETGKQVQVIADAARRLLLSYDWPGNVRQLQSAIRYAVVHATGDVITPECLPQECLAPCTASGGEGATGGELAPGWELLGRTRQLLGDGRGDVYRRILSEVDEHVIRLALEQTHGNQAQAAELLGISRMTLRSKLRHMPMAGE